MIEKKKTLIIFGAGGHGRVVADVATVLGHWTSVVFYDDFHPKGFRSGFWTVEGSSRDLETLSRGDHDIAVGIGDNVKRLELVQKILDLGFCLPPIVHPSASVSPRAELGPGSVVFPQSAINVGSSIGKGCIVNTGAIVDHDSKVGDGVHLSPGSALAGNVTVGKLSWVGIGACVKQGIVIGSQVMVGAGAVVVKDLQNSVTVVGVPARVRGEQ